MPGSPSEGSIYLFQWEQAQADIVSIFMLQCEMCETGTVQSIVCRITYSCYYVYPMCGFTLSVSTVVLPEN